MMDALIVKVLAVGLTLSQVFTAPPEQFRPSFDPVKDQQLVTEILHNGCTFFTQEFKAQKVDFDAMFTLMTAQINAQKERAAKAGETAGEKSYTQKLFEKVDLPSLHGAYKVFCKREKLATSPVDLAEVIKFYNGAFVNLPDHTTLKGKKLLEASVILDGDEKPFTEVYADNNRRRWISIKELPPYVVGAFVAAEDKRFYQHPGVDIRGVVRAFSTISGSGRPQGGSTITQQVVKNLLLNDDLTFERKMAEMVLATRVEKLLGKDEILELYLNYVFLGRASWGIEMAAQSYFGKSARKLTPAEAALLAGLTKGPNYYHPERQPERARDRREYVLGRMQDDGYITAEEFEKSNAEDIKMIPYDPPRTRGGFFYISEINREAKKLAGIGSLTSGSYMVHSTLDPRLQAETELALQNGLFNYEREIGRAAFTEAQGNLSEELAKTEATWQDVLPSVKPRLFDVRWPLATVIEIGKKRTRVGLADGREMALSTKGVKMQESLKLYDLIHVEVIEDDKKGPRAELRVPSQVQGAILVMENKTGRVLAMSGGFAYAQTQLNRATQTARQPGSTLKPFIYLSALNVGYQPNTLIPNQRIYFPPLYKGGKPWYPKNYDGKGSGFVTIRTAIENSLNIPTARMMAALGPRPVVGLDYIRGITQELGIYGKTDRIYPFILGAQDARLIDMAVAYATIANDGLRPTPHFIDLITENGKILYERPRFNLKPIKQIDRVSFYQLRRILEGTLVRGTATRIKDLHGIVAGKTGTSNRERDAWFIGFTNDITVATWVGYDSQSVRSSLGSRFTGGRVALPIAETVLRASFDVYRPMQTLDGPPKEIENQITEMGIDQKTGRFGGKFMEVFRIQDGQPTNSRMDLLTMEQAAYVEEEFDQYGAYQRPLGEEEDDSQIPWLNEDEDQYHDTDPDYPQRDGDGYQPGAEDMYDVWRNRGRQVDPFFQNPSFYYQ